MKSKKHYYAVIMAGGVGSRFWPVSTPDDPKQFHDMLGTGKSLICQTFDRLAGLIPTENILIATNSRYKTLVMSHLPDVSENQILLEPAMRNTAPCILYSALKINDLDEDAVMIVAPSDHLIEDEQEFLRNVGDAFKACQESDVLMTLGIKPSGPNTGYGYIQFEDDGAEVNKVVNFTEKPDLETAKRFLEQGDYLWNAGIFIWSVRSILQSFRTNLPGMHELFMTGRGFWNTQAETTFIDENYSRADNISIDYGIMEKADNVYVMATDFGWNDLGTWGSLYEKLDKDDQENASVNARTLFRSSKGNIVSTSGGKKVVIKGLNDYIIVDTDDTLMIFPKEQEQSIKEMSKEAEARFGEK
jgi:mannose-1-phosphate guanylyltransferase